MLATAQKCKITGKEFKISQYEEDFFERMGLPLPTLCIEERHRRRLAYRNERSIYKSTCDFTGKPIISLYSPDKDLTVYSQEAWWDDDWDAHDYGRDYDFNRPFFEQFAELQRAVPRLSLMNTKAENSEYCNITVSNKNCYLVFGGDFNEDCMNSVFCFHSRDCSDLYWMNRGELCYECVDCGDLYNCRYTTHSYTCRDSAFLFDCRGCTDCFACVGLRNKQYYFFNKSYSKEEYEQKIREYDLGSHLGVKKAQEEYFNFKLSCPHRASWIINCENSSGNNLVNVKNCRNCFDIEGPAEDLRDIILAGWNIKDAFSCDHVGHGLELGHELVGSIGGHLNIFGTFIWYSNDIFYSDMIVNSSHDLFGCSNMKKAEYCILNKQYRKEDYEDLRARIVEHMKSTGEWGEFFPIENSLWCYNETIAQDYAPLEKDEALKRGLKWHDEETKSVGSGDIVPESIDEVDESILDKTFVCKSSGRPYRINEKEYKLYKRLKVPIPHFAPETRNVMRFKSRNPWKIWERECEKCGSDITSSYDPVRDEKVVCETCYRKFVN